jgi:hypothetical protein
VVEPTVFAIHSAKLYEVQSHKDGGLGASLPVRGRSYEVFNVEIVMLTVLSSLYMLSIMLWYNFLSLYLGSFFEVEEVGLLLSILTAGGMLSIILGVF